MAVVAQAMTAQADAGGSASDGGSSVDGGTAPDAGGVTSTNLQLQVSENACAGNVAQDYLEVTNASSASVPLSSITFKYWIYDTSGVTVVPHIWYGGCVTTSNGSCVHPVSGVSITATPFSPSCALSATQQANWEITVSTTDTTPLPVGDTWGNIQTGVNLSNYQNFVPGNADWFSPCGSGGAYASNPYFAVYDQGNLVDTTGQAVVPTCRAPATLGIVNFIDQNFYGDGDIAHSFVTALGQPIDCIPFSAQHSVKALLAQGVTIPTAPSAPAAPSSMPPPNVPSNLAFTGQLDPNGSAQQCPAGTVPAIRSTVAQIQAQGGLAPYLQNLANRPRVSGSQSSFENDCWLDTVPGNGGAIGTADAVNWEHAVGIQSGGFLPSGAGGYVGMQFITPLYSPFVQFGADQANESGALTGADHSDSQLWAQTGNCETWYSNGGANQCPTGSACTPQSCAVQSLEVGTLTQQTGQSNLFVFFTADGYFTSCFAGSGSCASCPLVPPSPGSPPPFPDAGTNPPQLPPGAAVAPGHSDCWVAWPNAEYAAGMPLPSSTNGQPPFELQATVLNGSKLSPAAPGWWVFVNANLIGWYPPGTFNWPDGTAGPMSTGPATYLQAGGEVYDTWPGGKHTGTSMCSDNSPLSGFGFAAYQRNVGYFDATESFHDAHLQYFVAPASEGDDEIPGVCGLDSASWTNNAGAQGSYTLTTAVPPGAAGWGQFFYFGGGRTADQASTPHQVVVTLSDIEVQTTSSTTPQCSGPNPPATTSAAPAVDVLCTPEVNSGGSLSTTPVAAAQEVACIDGVGAWVVVTCAGTGVAGSSSIATEVSAFLTSTCNVNGQSTAIEQADVTLSPGVPQQVGQLFVCDGFFGSNLPSCSADPTCLYNVLEIGTVTAFSN